ncbi:hypothetical protein HEBU111660_07820 [Helicobacter burdigaliensis]
MFPLLIISPCLLGLNTGEKEAESEALNLLISASLIADVEATNLFALILPLSVTNTPLGFTKNILLFPPFKIPARIEEFFE